MKYKNRIIVVLLILAVIFAALYYIPIGRDVKISMPCVIWDKNDPTVGEAEGIAIKGRYYDYLIKDDRFIGSVIVSEVNNYEEDVEMNVRVSKHHGMKSASLFYYSRVHRRTVDLGSLYTQDEFDSMLIFLHGAGFDKLWKGKVVSAPATTIEEAVAIAEAMNFA